LCLLGIASLLLIERSNYLLFHSLAELACILVAFGMFIITWHSRRVVLNNMLAFLGVAYLFVGFLDFIHLLAFKGMGVFPNAGTDLCVQLWISGRYLESLSIFLAIALFGRSIGRGFIFAGYALVTGAVLVSIFGLGVFPVCYVEGTGITSFKIASEYAITFVLLASVVSLRRLRRQFEPRAVHLLTASLVITACSEMAFTLYTDVYGFFNMLGHILKMVSYYLIYKAIVETGLVNPHELLFRELKRSEANLAKVHDELQVRVARQTAELSVTSQELEKKIADHLGAERERESLQAQLIQSQKMEAIGRLAGGVAHDFNNLLSVIVGYSELVLTRTELDDETRKSLEQVQQAGERAAQLTSQLLAFSRKQVLEPKVIDVCRAILDLEKMLKRMIGEDVVLTCVGIRGLGNVRVDPTQLEQVILNLAVNARDAMPEGGNLTIEAQNVSLDEDYSRHRPEVSPGPYVMIAVTDTGLGMDDEVKSQIFEPFFTTKERGRGTGLGLSTVHGIVKQSGGHIWVYSEKGRGTTFRIYFPRVDAEDSDLPADGQAVMPRGTETILIVDDEEAVRELVARVLGEQGYRILVASDGESALKMCESYRDDVDVILTDVVMPRMSGKELAEKALKLKPEAKVIYMSGYSEHAILGQGAIGERADFIQKPASLTALTQKVRQVLDRREEGPAG